MFQQHKKQAIALTFILVAFVLLTMQSNPPFFILFPILLLTLVTSWYLYKEIKRDNEESLEQGIRYMQEEAQAQRWLHKSFVPKARKLAKRELGSIIIASGAVLLSFVFLWSYFVSGFFAAWSNTLMALFFFLGFILYTLYAPREFTKITRHVPRRYRHHSKSDWVHAYLLLFPFAAIAFFLYSLTTTGESVTQSLVATIIFLFSYTLLFICLYCIWFLYREYQKEVEEKLKQTAKKLLNE
jgi:hypothetical protein